MGCYAFLNKPVEPRQLYKTVQAATELVPREHIRIGAEVPVMVGNSQGPGVPQIPSTTKTLSEGGMYLRTQSLQPRNVRIPITIIIKGREINAEGVVIYSNGPQERSLTEPGMGLKFTKLSDEDRDFLRRFIQEQLTHDLSVDS